MEIKTLTANGVQFEYKEDGGMFRIWSLIGQMWHVSILEDHYYTLHLKYFEEEFIVYGLCDVFHVLADMNIISDETRDKGLNEIRKFNPDPMYYYWDTWTIEGKEARINYCFMMARSLVPAVLEV